MTMQVTVEGEDITPEELQGAGWRSAFTKRKSSQKCLPAENEQPANTTSGSSNGGSRTPASVKKRLVAASRMPRLPREHLRVIVRPRGGLNVKNCQSNQDRPGSRDGGGSLFQGSRGRHHLPQRHAEHFGGQHPLRT
ncbi:unnamed protein product [Ixodes hexagonus]